MQLLKIGDRYINLDLVIDIVLDQSEQGDVRVVAINGGTTFKGEEAKALRYFLDANCDDVMEINRTQEYDRKAS